MQRLDTVDERRTDHRLEFGTGDPHLGLDVGQQDRYRGIGVRRERLLGLDAVGPQSGHRVLDRRVVLVELVDGLAQAATDVGEHRGVEVDAAEPLDSLRLAENLESNVGSPQNRSVEGPSPEVIDGDDLTGVEPLLGRIEDGGGFGLCEQDHLVGQVGDTDALTQQIDLVGTPISRMTHRDGVGRSALACRDLVDHGSQQSGHQGLRRIWAAADQDRRRVTQPPLELSSHPLGFGHRPTIGCFAGELGLVLPQQHHRRDSCPSATQAGDLYRTVAPDRSSREGRP